MSSVSLFVAITLACLLTPQSLIKASPIFSDDVDKPTPFRYSVRVERIEFGDTKSEDDSGIYTVIEDCSEEDSSSEDSGDGSDGDYEIIYNPGDDEEECYEDEEIEEEDSSSVEESEEGDEYVDISDDDEDSLEVYDESEEEVDEEEDTSYEDNSIENNPQEEDDEVYIPDEDQHEEETPDEDNNIEDKPQEEDNEIIDYEQEETTEGFPGHYDDQDIYDYLDEYYDEKIKERKGKFSPTLKSDIVTLRTVKKNHPHERKPESQFKNHFKGLKTPFPAFTPKVKAPKGAHPHKIAAVRPSPSKRHQRNHSHKSHHKLV